MNLQNLQALLEVVEAGSVQSAAEKMRLPRSTLRRRLENLEAEVGEPLLMGDSKGITLTSAGRVVVEDGALLLAQTGRMLSRARAPEIEAKGTIRVMVPVGLPKAPAIAVLSTLAPANPGLRVELRELEDPVMHLHEPFELLLHFGPSPPRKDWFSKKIQSVDLRALASPAYLDRCGAPLTLAELAHHRLLHWKTLSQGAHAWPLLDGGAHPIEPWLTSRDLGFLLCVADAGLGILVAPTMSFGDASGGNLVNVLETTVGGSIDVRTLSPHPSHVEPRVRVFLENIQRSLASLGPD